ncbi:hypothetical protein [Psychrobacillus sp.]|uniref:hypothetical protein n=1 Tax=Psychrobacillus sp. TaxID=1871623 RepID=UPI0028BDA580|nr:hypothetical protein [Psychrobacillus sp.]
MTEWLTTGQMIDRLKVGQIAATEKYNHQGTAYVSKEEQGGFYWCDKEGRKDDYIILGNKHFTEADWRILPTFVSFEDVMKAFKEDKKVKIHFNDGGTLTLTKYASLPQLCFHDFLECKWTIEGDTP